MLKKATARLSLVLGLITIVLSGYARADTINCTAITAVPYTISSSGTYCLTGNLTYAGDANAIEIAADNVILDFNGWEIHGTGYIRTTGVYATGDRITIRNGRLVEFLSGIHIRGTDDLIENMKISNIAAVGIQAGVDSTIIRNNHISHLNGSWQSTNGSGTVNGIVLDGGGTIGNAIRVVNNTITQFTPKSGSVGSTGIRISRGPDTILERNFIDGLPLVFYEDTTAIYIEFSQNVLAVNNRITRTTKGIVYGYDATGVYMENLTSGVTTPFTGGTPAGVNH